MQEVKTNKYSNIVVFIPFAIVSALTLLTFLALTSASSSAATDSVPASVHVPDACTMNAVNDGTATPDNPYEMITDTYRDNIGTTTITITCNDNYGYSLYAVGYGGNTIGNTDMIGSTTGTTIPTGIVTDASVSNWAFKLTPVTTTFTPTITSNEDGSFSNYHKIPSTSTKVATYTGSVDVLGSSTITSSYAVGVFSYQQPDTYTGQIKYTLIHPSYADSEGNVTYMQDLTPTSIAALLPNIGDVATVVDSRDEQPYKIAKLADGKYWMTSNLNLAGGTVLSSDKSDVPSSNYYTLPASTAISSGTKVPSGQFSSDSTAYVFNTGNNTTTCNSSTPCNSYYSWLAATAGGKDSSGNAVTTNGYNAAYSICPKGWRLPTSTTSNASAQTSPNWKTGDWYALATSYGANLESSYYENAATFYTNAGPGTTPNFLLAGYYDSGSFNNGGSDGYYWSSTASSSTGAYRMYFNSSVVYSANNRSRGYGYSVRCVFDDYSISDVSTMQDVTSHTAENTPIGTTATLEDSRDNKSYTVAKLADGKIWMTSNLNLAGGTVLSSDKSDVPTSNYYTLPTSTTISSGTSVQSGQFSDNYSAYVFNTGNNTNNCASDTPCNSYYSWLAATAGGKDSSGTAVTTYHNAAYSICPKGWRLPAATTSNASPTTSPNWETGDWYQMIIQYMGGATSLNQGYYDNTNPNPFLTNAGPGTTPNFLLTGSYNSGSFGEGGSGGEYWSSTAGGSNSAYRMNFYSSSVSSASNSIRRSGLPVRCLLK